MPEIRITRSAGQNWNGKFGPGAHSPADPNTSILANVDAVLKGVGPLAGSSVPVIQITEVSLNNVAEGDVLRFTDSKWRNYGEANLTDGGNF